MVLKIKRSDGFFNFFSDYHVYLNDKKVKLSHKEEVEVDLPKGDYQVYSRFYWLKSTKKTIQLKNDNSILEVKLFINRQQWYKLIVIIILSIIGLTYGNGIIQDFSLFILKFWLAFYIFVVTVGSDLFMRLDFQG